MTRQIILDTETTGLEPKEGHRIIEVGCVEMIDRQLTGNNFHQYLKPDREIDAGAIEVHGITNEFLADKPRFEDIAEDLVAYLEGAELIIHNAPFDIGFLNHELKRAGVNYKTISEYCTVIDTLVMARDLFPGQRNSLDALCKRYEINNSHRTLHGALLDSEILGDVYLAMTGGQVSLLLGSKEDNKAATGQAAGSIRRMTADMSALPVLRADEAELAAHAERLAAIEATAGKCLWVD
jgi:DNA polymerase-3 subunit epsilon